MVKTFGHKTERSSLRRCLPKKQVQNYCQVYINYKLFDTVIN